MAGFGEAGEDTERGRKMSHWKTLARGHFMSTFVEVRCRGCGRSADFADLADGSPGAQAFDAEETVCTRCFSCLFDVIILRSSCQRAVARSVRTDWGPTLWALATGPSFDGERSLDGASVCWVGAEGLLGDEILEALEKIDELDAQVNAANSELAQGEQEEQRVQQTVRDATPLLEADLARLTDELNENKSQLPEDFRSEFDRISEARGENALAPMEGETCGACYQTLNPQTVNKLLLDQLVFCPSCGCLLYLAEDRSVGAS